MKRRGSPAAGQAILAPIEGTDVRRRLSRRTWLITILIAAFLVAAVVGACLDWVLWADDAWLLVTLAAMAILVGAGLLGLIGLLARRGIIRRTATLVLAVALGLFAGQIVGPRREPLIHTFDGTLTLHLSSPFDAVATGPVTCTNVASGTEFAVSGDSNMRLETADRPFATIYANVGDRWRVRDGAPRKDGVRFDLYLAPQLVEGTGKGGGSTLIARPSSTLESTFSNAGGSIRFAELVAEDSPDSIPPGEPYAGTVTWTCGTEATP